MNANALLECLQSIGHFGHIVSTEEQIVLQNSLLVLQNENHFRNVFFWGKILGADKDYYVAYGYVKDALHGNIFYYSNNGINWGLLPQPTKNGLLLTPLCTTSLQGDPALIIDVLIEKDETSIEETLRAAQIRKLKEEDRLASLVRIICSEAAVAPRGVNFQRPDGVIVENLAFEGLSALEAREFSSFLHARPPTQKYNTNLLTRDDYNYAMDFLDPLDIDIPEGSWIIQILAGDSIVLLKSLFWPGLVFYHFLKTPRHGFVYIGNGKRAVQSNPDHSRNVMYLVIIFIACKFATVFGKISPVSEARHEELLVDLIRMVLGKAENVCYFEDDRYGGVLPRAFATKTSNSFVILAQSKCDFYILHVKLENLQSALKHLIPHTKVIVINSKRNDDSSQWTLDSKLLYERGLFPLAVSSPEGSKVVQVTHLQTNTTLQVHRGENFSFPLVTWSPKDFLRFTGRNIVITTFHCPPFVETTENGLEGLEQKIIHELVQDWPIEYKIIPDEKGVLMNKFLLAIESVQTEQSDIAFCFLWQRVLMERNVDFSTAMFPTCVTFLVHKPKLLQSYTFLFQAFQDINTFITCLLTIAVLEIIYKVFITDLWQAKALFERSAGSHLKLQLTSSRICLNYIRSFTDMVEQQTQWVEPKNDIQKWLKKTNDSICMGIAQNFRIGDNRTEINKKLKSGQYGFLVKRFAQDFVSGSEELDDYAKIYLRPIPGCLATFYSSIAFQKNSPFPLYLNRKISSMLESGIVNYWRQLTLRKPAYGYLKSFKSLYVDQMVTSKFDIDKLSGILYFLVFGFGLSIVCFVNELFNGRKKPVKCSSIKRPFGGVVKFSQETQVLCFFRGVM
ncbi:hypothetical protein HUJ04_001792 [Dendroctonus ponderosae]|nr:hypothetical protein HUJ04_001792 [Dendroctonus ponderosae]